VTLLRELAEANHKVRGACVVILADRDKIEMDAEIAEAMKHHKLRVVTRSGSVMSTTDLGLVSLATSKAVIVLGPEKHADGTAMAPHESDTIVLKSLLAIGKIAPERAPRRRRDLRRVDRAGRAARCRRARRVDPRRAVISRLLVQTGRQSGLSAVYSELLDFEGVEIYMKDVSALVGKTFREAVFATTPRP